MRKDEWSKEHLEYLANNYHRMTYAEIGRVVKKSRSAVGGMASRLNLTKKESNNEKPTRNTKNKIHAFTGYLSDQTRYNRFEQGGRCELEAVA